MLALWICFCVIGNSFTETTTKPEQIHLALADSPNDIVVTWVTLQKTKESIVIFNRTKSFEFVIGTQTPFTDGGKEQRKIFIHSVKLTKLQPDTIYEYSVGGDTNNLWELSDWSNNFTFRTFLRNNDWPLRVAILGDMGVENGNSIPYLEKEVLNHKYHFVIHNGDFAYDMDDNEGRVGDKFMNLIQNIASRVPYMTAVGNHEQLYNFSHYKSRFQMPGEHENLFYSYNVGKVHFIAFASDLYYFRGYGTDQIIHQYSWLENDLAVANLPKNRINQPWIIAYSHRPMYCSNSDDLEHCPNPENLIRVGFPVGSAGYKQYILGLEDLFFRNHVDIIFAAHEHSYERMFPVFNNMVCNSSTNDAYVNPTAPVHFVSGAAGNKEKQDPFFINSKPWSAFRSDDYGYTDVYVLNSTHIKINQLSIENGLHIIDSITIIKSLEHTKFTCNIQSLDTSADWRYTDL